MRKQLLITIALVTTAATSLAESPVDGQWDFHMSSQMGTVDAVVTMLTQDGTLTGEFDLGNGRKWAIEEGTIEGNQIKFNINRDGAAMTYVMAATVEGNQVSGTASAWGSTVPRSMSR